MRSIRSRLTLMLMAGLVAIVTLGVGLLYPTVRETLIREFDHAQLAKLRTLITLPEPGRHGINLGFTQRILPEYQPREKAEYFQVWLHDGSTLARSPSLGAHNLPARFGTEAAPLFFDIRLPDGSPGRAVGMGFSTANTGPATARTGVRDETDPFTLGIVLARDTRRLNRVLARLLGGVVLGGAALIILMAVMVRTATRAGLRPLKELAQKVRSIQVDSPGLPLIADRHRPEELQPVVEQLQSLIQRVQSAIERERRFTANAAHELMTPIAEIRSLAEAAALWSNDPEATAQLATDVLEIGRQMEHLVTNLLALTRAEARVAVLQIESLDFIGLLRRLLDGFSDRIASKNIRLECDLPAQAPIRSDRILLQSILYNLLDNAVEYCPANGTIACHVRSTPEDMELRIGNTALDLPAGDLEHVFEPLWRNEAARSDRSHSGLGLSLARAFSRSLGLQLFIPPRDPGTFAIALRCPASDGTSQQPLSAPVAA
jgi:signal transduction histidine kinase